jgi:hypothetical protein
MIDENENQILARMTNSSPTKISNLERRAIQSPVIACLLSGFISELGHDRAMEIASAAIRSDATQAGKIMAEKYGGNTIEMLQRVIKQEWAEDNALEFAILELTDHKLNFNVTRCLYAELYDRLGLKEYGFCLSCNRDAPFIQGFNPKMKLIRTQTIMQGAENCDFRIRNE